MTANNRDGSPIRVHSFPGALKNRTDLRCAITARRDKHGAQRIQEFELTGVALRRTLQRAQQIQAFAQVADRSMFAKRSRDLRPALSQ